MFLRSSGAFVFVVLLMAMPISLPMNPVEDDGGAIVEGAGIRALSELSDLSDVRYAIITTEALSGAFLPLASWRSQTGDKAHIFLLDGPDGILMGDGRDPAEKLFNFITDLDGATSHELEYVLLGGDAELVPTRYLWAGASGWDMDDHYLSDLYYSSPGTEWDVDGDGRFGERSDIGSIGVENLTFSLVVGRAPVSNATEAERFVERVISYEMSPAPGNWSKTAVLSSSLMDRPNVLNDPLTPDDEGYDAYKDNGWKAIQNYTMVYLPRSLTMIEAHDHPFYEGGNYTEANDTMGFDTLKDLLSAGCSFFTFAGQSFYDAEYPVNPPLAYSLAQWLDPFGTASSGSGFGQALTYEDTWNLTNGEKLPVVYLSSCDSANFSDPGDRDLSNIVIAPNGGAICMIGPTGITWRGEGGDYSLGNWYLMPRFWQQFLNDNMPGRAMFRLKEAYLRQKWDEIATKETLLVGLYSYNYLGDPALSAWVGTPGDMVLYDAPSEVHAGTDDLTVEVRTDAGSIITGAEVSIYSKNDSMVFTGSTGPDGKAKIQVSFSAPGEALLTVRARNMRPVVANVTIIGEPVDISVAFGSIAVTPPILSEDRAMTISATIMSEGGGDEETVKAGVIAGVPGPDPGSWPEPLAFEEFPLSPGLSVNVGFELMPLRSWSILSIVAYPAEGEMDLSDNVRSIDVDINARPVFLSVPLVQFEEDRIGGMVLDLTESIFDPDNDTSDLTCAIEVGAPSWIQVSAAGMLSVVPPENWTGSMSLEATVSDGLASDSKMIEIFVVPVNDAPAVSGLESMYEAYADTPFSLPLELIDAEGDEVTLLTSSDLDGLIFFAGALRFVPYPEDAGGHNVTLRLNDPSGANRSYVTTINVLPPSDRLYFLEPSIYLPTATVDKEYSYRLGIGGGLAEVARFEDNTSLFDIGNDTGTISFTPHSQDTGEHWVRITVTSGEVTITRAFILEVKETERAPTTLLWVLGISISLVIVLIVAIYLWSGPKVEQYGSEE